MSPYQPPNAAGNGQLEVTGEHSWFPYPIKTIIQQSYEHWVWCERVYLNCDGKQSIFGIGQGG